MTRLVGAIAVALCCACAAPEPGQDPPTPSGPFLSFHLEGAGFQGRTFGPGLADFTGYWLYDPHTQQTQIHLSGNDGSWRAGLDLAVTLSGPGTYEADPSYRGIDRGFVVALADHATGTRIGLVASDATLKLEPNAGDPDSMSGTFSGRFAVGNRTTGRDILDTPDEERRYATIRDGRFRVRWRDTMHGKGRRWPRGSDPRS